jgi:hypothetical protein
MKNKWVEKKVWDIRVEVHKVRNFRVVRSYFITRETPESVRFTRYFFLKSAINNMFFLIHATNDLLFWINKFQR